VLGAGVLGVVLGVLEALGALSAADNVAPVRMNFASGAVPLVPVAPGAAEPAVPVGFGFAALAVSPGIAGAAFRQPVTTIFLSELDGALC
jgi:hypothetical protein